jgi:UDP-glucose 4-epimerase
MTVRNIIQNILVAGANSFVGNRLIYELKNNTANHITGVYHKNTNYLHADIINVPIVDIQKLQNDFDILFLVSAFVPVNNKITTRERALLFETNVELVYKLCTLFTNAKIIYCSSVSVFSLSDIICENSNMSGLNEYGISKIWAEKVVESVDNYAILRFSSIYGEGMKMNTFLSNCIKQAITNNEIVIYGTGERRQDYIHVSDVVEFLLSASQHTTNEIFLGVSGKSHSNIEIAKIISQVTDSNIIFKGEDNSPSFVYDNYYTCQALSYKAKMNINDGIKALIEWIRKQY